MREILDMLCTTNEMQTTTECVSKETEENRKNPVAIFIRLIVAVAVPIFTTIRSLNVHPLNRGVSSTYRLISNRKINVVI